MPFHAVTFNEAVHLLVALAQGDEPTYAVTANVDHVVRFHRCPQVRTLYTDASLILADGTPLVWVSRLLGRPLPERVAGSDLLPRLCAEAANCGLSVFFLGGSPGTAQRAADVLRERHPRLEVAGTYCPPYGFETDPEESERIVHRIRDTAPDLLFVGLGSPKQERWIATNRNACGAKLSIGIGISFSFVSGAVRRAPTWMQRIGLEWAHRLIQEPRRLGRRYLIEDTFFLRLVLQQLFKRNGTAEIHQRLNDRAQHGRRPPSRDPALKI